MLGIGAAVSGAFFLSQRFLRYWEALYLIFPAFLCSMGLILLGRLKPALVTSQAVWIGCGWRRSFLHVQLSKDSYLEALQIHLWSYWAGFAGLCRNFRRGYQRAPQLGGARPHPVSGRRVC